jgi:hypothetical protein
MKKCERTLIGNGLEKLALNQISIFNLNCYYICRKILNTCKKNFINEFTEFEHAQVNDM